MIQRIEDFIAQPPRAEQQTGHERRQAENLDDLLIKANRAAQAARRVAMMLISTFLTENAQCWVIERSFA